MYPGQRIQAIGSPRKSAPSGCEAPRESARESQRALVVAAYAGMIRVKWDGDSKEEAGWRRAEDFAVFPSS
jgi:hypothetical protein